MATTFENTNPKLVNDIQSNKKNWPVWDRLINVLKTKPYQILHNNQDYHVINLSTDRSYYNQSYSLVFPVKPTHLLHFPHDLTPLIGMKLIVSNDTYSIQNQLNYSGAILDGGGYGNYTVNYLVQSGDPNNLLPWLFGVDTYSEYLKLNMPQDLFILQNDTSGHSILYDSMDNVYCLNEFCLKRIASLEDFAHFSLHALFCGMNWYDAYPNLEFQKKFNLSYYSEVGQD
ncbi:MAG: hypothetical protein KC646_05390 [Candidatus Cloacimonetes bacterium]|nr:hypothetical protein [Candidatus Cloacimonadota bacterium]